MDFNNIYYNSKRREKIQDVTIRSKIREGKWFPSEKVSVIFEKHLLPVVSNEEWPKLRETIVTLEKLEKRIFNKKFIDEKHPTFLLENYYDTMIFENKRLSESKDITSRLRAEELDMLREEKLEEFLGNIIGGIGGAIKGLAGGGGLGGALKGGLSGLTGGLTDGLFGNGQKGSTGLLSGIGNGIKNFFGGNKNNNQQNNGGQQMANAGGNNNNNNNNNNSSGGNNNSSGGGNSGGDSNTENRVTQLENTVKELVSKLQGGQNA